MASSGLRLLADPFYPGWRATIDGAEAPVLRADFAVRAVGRIDHLISTDLRSTISPVTRFLVAANLDLRQVIDLVGPTDDLAVELGPAPVHHTGGDRELRRL